MPASIVAPTIRSTLGACYAAIIARPGGRSPHALNPPLCPMAAKPSYSSRTHSTGVLGAGGGAHGHLVGDAGRPPTGPDAPYAQEAARGLEWHGRAHPTCSGPALCRSRGSLADARDGSRDPAPGWGTLTHRVP